MAGPAIFFGNLVKLLKPGIDFFGAAQILSGTVNPTVTATSAPIGSLYLNSSSGITYKKMDAGLTTNWLIMPTSELASTTAGGVYFGNGTQAVQDVPNFFWDDTNNRLGIGTNAPTNQLHLLGSFSNVVNQRIQNSAANGYSGIEFYNNSAQLRGSFGFANPSAAVLAGSNFFNTETGVNFIFSVSGAERMRMQSDGTFGINTSGTPGAQIDVRSASASRIGAIVRGAASQTANLQEWQNSAGTILASIDESGFFGSGLGATAPIYPIDAVTPTTGSFVQRLTRVTNNTTGFNSTNILVSQSTGTSLDSFGGGSVYAISDSAGVSNSFLGSVGAVRDGASNSGRLVFNTYLTGTIGEKMTIMASGRVGIGTTAPGSALHIVGDAIRGQSTATDATTKQFDIVQGHFTNAEEPLSLFTTISNNTQSIIWIGGGSGSYNAATDVRFFTGASTTTLTGSERMRINSSGAVSIGTTSALGQLSIVPSTAATIGQVMRGAASQTANLTQWQDSAGTILASVTSGGFFQAGGTTGQGTLKLQSDRAAVLVKGSTDAPTGPFIDYDINSTVTAGTTFIRLASGTISGATSGTNVIALVSPTYNPAAGSGIFRAFDINYTNNASGAQSGSSTGLRVNRNTSGTAFTTDIIADFQAAGASLFLFNAIGNLTMASSTARIFLGGSTSQAGFTYDSSSTGLLIRSNRTSAAGYCFSFSSGQGPITTTSGANGRINLGQGFSPTSGTGTWAGITISETINQTGGANGITRGLFVNPTLTSASSYRAIEMSNAAGYGIYQSSNTASNYFNGAVGIGTAAPDANLHLKAGTATAGTAPLKLTSGTNLTTPEAGAIEYDGTNLYYTDSTATRKTLASSTLTAPTYQQFPGGTSGTYTTPANVLYLRVTLIGGGGGGGGSGVGGGTGGTGGNTTFASSLVVANGGTGGTYGGTSTNGGAGGGGSSGAAITLFLSQGTTGSSYFPYNSAMSFTVGPEGGAGPLGGGTGRGGSAGTNSGSGGGGGRADATPVVLGNGGGAGGYAYFQINSPAATYSYAAGAGGTAGTAGTSGFAGTAGAAGQIIIEEFYQ